jgi:hypothetical protein
VKVAVRHGVQATAHRLRLNATRLQARVRRFAPTQAAEDQSGLVELRWPGAAPIPECLLEAEDHSGRKLRIHLKGPATAQAATLGRMLWTGEE